MGYRTRRRPLLRTLSAAAGALGLVAALVAQGPTIVPAVDPPADPVLLYTAEYRIRVVPVADGLSHPWGMAFRRNGDILVTERDRGALRVIRDGQLLPHDIPGVPTVFQGTQLAGLMDVVVHPDDDQLVYLTYSKPATRDGEDGATVALARGRLEDGALTATRDLFVAEGWGQGIAASRLLWAPDETLLMSVGGAFQFDGVAQLAQDPHTHFGKLLRLTDQGKPPTDNPFVGNPDYLPEIYSLGHRNQIGLAHHPETGALWATEHGVQGGDEANIIRPGGNYGWPIASYSRTYGGEPISTTPWRAEFESPELLWWPSIGPSGLTFYNGDDFPKWRGNLFVGSMMVGRMPRTGHLERVVFNRQGQEIRREWLLTELKQRIREVQQGPDGLLYLLTEEDDAILMRIEPAHTITDPPGNILTMRRLSEPRVAPLPEPEWTAGHRATVEQFGTADIPANALATLLRAHDLADGAAAMLRYVSSESTLAPRERKLLILRTAWLTQNASLWAHHASRAGSAGLDDADIRRIAQRPDDDTDPFEAALLDLADELYRNSSVTDRTWERLAARYDRNQLLDAVVTVSEITAQSVVLNTLGVPPDAGSPARLPATEIPYRINVPDREPPLTRPRVEPVPGDEPELVRTLRQHPALAASWEAALSDASPELLAANERELISLRTAWNTRSGHAWGRHAAQARAQGLDPHWIAQGGDADGWNARELTLIDAANELYRDAMVSNATWNELANHYDTQQRLRIVVTGARARAAAMTVNALGVQPHEDDEPLPVLEGY